jgi:hypothetical protein
MTTLSDFRARVRRDLKDADSQSYRWTDDEIDGAIQHALAEFSRYSPREIKSTLATTAGEAGIDVSSLAQRIKVDKVEFPAGTTPRTFARFSQYGDRVTLHGAVGDGQDCHIYWAKMHTVDEEQSTVPAHLEDVLIVGATAFAAISQAQYHVDRANIGGDRAARDYEEWGKMRLQRFYAALRKFGRRGMLYKANMYPATDHYGSDQE